MKDKILNILHEDMDWVKNVNEHDNFFEWFRGDNTKPTNSGRRPGDWIGRDVQWWIDHTQDVDFALSGIHMDISDMRVHSEKIDAGISNAGTIMGLVNNIYEFVENRNGTNDIEDYVNDIRSFIKEFRGYFGESMTVSDMVSSVGESMMYAQENDIPIHRQHYGTDLGFNESITEDFDWAIKDTVPFLEVGEPLKKQQPKNQYRLHVTHGVGEDHGTWIPNWMNYDPNTPANLDTLMRHIRILDWKQENYREGVWGLASLCAQGETWMLSKQDNENIKNEFGEYNKNVGIWEKESEEFDEDEVRDVAWEWLGDELMDYGLREHDSYYQEDATVEDWKVTYFDEFGVEHAVKVNLPQG
jgi:hypothetical protein